MPDARHAASPRHDHAEPAKAAPVRAPDQAIEAAVRAAIRDVEGQVAAFRGMPRHLRRGSMALVAQGAAERLRQVTDQIQPLRAQGMIAPLPDEIRRLDAAVHTLFTMAKSGTLALAESHLAELFDREDALRVALGEPPAGRADHFYDEAAGPAGSHTPDGAEAQAAVLRDAETGGEAPTTRAGYLASLRAGPSQLGVAFDAGYGIARDTIAEPPPLEHAGALDALLDVALGFIGSAAFGALGQAIGKAMTGLTAVKRVEDVAGHAVQDVLIDAVKDLGEDVVKQGGAQLGGRLGAPPEAARGLSPKTAFLMRTRQATAAAVQRAFAGFAAHEAELHRLPTETLQALSSGLTRGLEAFQLAYGHVLVREWVSFLHAATQDGAMRASSGAGAGFAQASEDGVLRIELAVHRGGAEVRSARLAGVDPAVLANLAGQPFSLQTLPIHRRVVISGGAQRLPVTFDVTRAQTVEPPGELDQDQVDLLATIAGFGIPGVPRERYPGREALPMLHVALMWLGNTPASRIAA